jgi:hypothetical protein
MISQTFIPRYWGRPTGRAGTNSFRQPTESRAKGTRLLAGPDDQLLLLQLLGLEVGRGNAGGLR